MSAGVGTNKRCQHCKQGLVKFTVGGWEGAHEVLKCLAYTCAFSYTVQYWRCPPTRIWTQVSLEELRQRAVGG